jgi:hypothetical protein
LSFLKKWLVTKVVVFYLLFACLLILDTEDHIWDVQITKMAYHKQPVQQQLTKAFFFYLIQIKGRRDKSFKLRFNFYHLHATISTRLFFFTYEIVDDDFIFNHVPFLENALEIIFGGVPQSGNNNTRCP